MIRSISRSSFTGSRLQRPAMQTRVLPCFLSKRTKTCRCEEKKVSRNPATSRKAPAPTTGTPGSRVTLSPV